MSLFVKLNYQKYNFNESGKLLHVAGLIPFFLILGRGSVTRGILTCLQNLGAVNHVWAARHAAAPWFLFAQAALPACLPMLGSSPRTLQKVFRVLLPDVWTLCTT